MRLIERSRWAMRKLRNTRICASREILRLISVIRTLLISDMRLILWGERSLIERARSRGKTLTTQRRREKLRISREVSRLPLSISRRTRAWSLISLRIPLLKEWQLFQNLRAPLPSSNHPLWVPMRSLSQDPHPSHHLPRISLPPFQYRVTSQPLPLTHLLPLASSLLASLTPTSPLRIRRCKTQSTLLAVIIQPTH